MALHVLTRVPRPLRLAVAAAILGATLAAASSASAQNAIGTAAVVRNDVSRQRDGQSTALPTGGAVFLQESIRTGANSSARLVFRDDTALAIGALATIVLDTATFGGTGSPKTILNMAGGAFRFLSGTATKDLEIRTNLATIGIRGTEFDVRSTPAQTTVTLRAGEVEVCPIAGERICVILRRPGDTATVDATGPARTSPTQFSFSSLCTADPALCGAPTRFAAPRRPVTPPLERTARAERPARVRLAGPVPVPLPVQEPAPTAVLCGR